jgi:iron complex outermembrane receptor protein
MNGHFLVGVATCAIVALSCLSSVAHAQTQTEATPSWAGDTIIVTGQRETYAALDTGAATRTDTPLIEVPQSVQVLTRTLLQECQTAFKRDPRSASKRDPFFGYDAG